MAKKSGERDSTERIPIAVKVCQQVITTLELMLDRKQEVSEEQLRDLLNKARIAVAVDYRGRQKKK
jgi:hypothetical protein